jgi:hypothetical protein
VAPSPCTRGSEFNEGYRNKFKKKNVSGENIGSNE